MEVIHNITIDMVKKGVTPRVYAMQYDTNARAVCVEMLSNGNAWNPPGSAVISLSYQKPDGKKGFYSKLEENQNAVSVSDNKVTVTLAHQVLTVAGVVDAAIVAIIDNQRIATFPFEIHVKKDPGAGNTISDDYFNPGAAENAVLFTPQTLTPAQQAQARRNIGITDTGSTPIAYLYNGVELPPLPEWDREAYLYALISYRDATDVYYFSVYKKQNYYTKQNTMGDIVISETTYFGSDDEENSALVFELSATSTKWEKMDRTTWSVSVDKDYTAKDPVIWSNFGLLYSDGTPYMDASDPVPVYPESGGCSGGSGLPYFALTATTVAKGEMVELADEDKAALLSIIEPMVSSGKILPIVAAIPAGAVLTAVLSAVANIAALDDWQIIYCGNIWMAEGVLSVALTVNSARSAVITVGTIEISGADTEAIAADMEAILNGRY